MTHGAENWADLAVEKPGVTLLILWRSIERRIPKVTAIVAL